MNPVKILILTVLAGMGHIRAGEAIKEAIEGLSKEVEVKCVDPLRFTHPKLRELINQFYLWIIQSPQHHLWGFLYGNNLISSAGSPFRWLISKEYAKSIQEFLKGFKPSVIVSTHPFTTAGVALLKKRRLIEYPLVSCATDFDVHPFGIWNEVDLFIVPDITRYKYLQKKGIPKEKVEIVGIPIAPRFAQERTKKELRERLGLGGDLPILLVLSGGFGVGPIEKILISLKGLGKIIQVVVVVGKNEVLKKRLKRIGRDLRVQIKIFGFVENMEDLMGASDLVITKPGGLTMSEALAKELPIILLRPIKGQEVNNFKYLVTTGAAIYAKEIREIPGIIAHLFTNPNKLSSMKLKVKEISRPDSSIQIAKSLLRLAEGKDICFLGA